MNVGDIMTQEVFSVGPEASLADAVALMLRERISGVPVINEMHVLLGIISEGDLLRRTEIDTERSRPHWLEFALSPEKLATDYVQSHARKVAEVMTRNVAVTTEDMTLDKAVDLLERNHIKRMPVLRDGRVVGIISRANLLRALAAHPPLAQPTANDAQIKETLWGELCKHPWGAQRGQILVNGGVVDLWGCITSEAARSAVCVAAENIPGVKEVRDHLTCVGPYGGAVTSVSVESAKNIVQ